MLELILQIIVIVFQRAKFKLLIINKTESTFRGRFSYALKRNEIFSKISTVGF